MRLFKWLFAVPLVAVLTMAAISVGVSAAAGTAVKKPSKHAYHPVWLCRPGLAHNPCGLNLQTGLFSPSGTLESTITPTIPSPSPAADCFYVYPTVSNETSLLSNLKPQAAEIDVAHYQAAYYQSVCRIYAPMYHQLTLFGNSVPEPAAIGAAGEAEQYSSLLNAWKYYLAHYNHGRPFVLIGHSQGAFTLRKLIRQQIDSNPKLRRRMLSTILYGGGVVVKLGSLVGGDFKHIPGCTSTTQLGCVVSYSSFEGTPPPGNTFGTDTFGPTDEVEPLEPGYQILCTNPAALGGGSGTLDTVFPDSFPNTAGAPVPATEVPGGATDTPFFEYNDSYTAQCVSNGVANNYLEITPENGAPDLVSTGALAPFWGLHQLDANLAQGNIVNLIASEMSAYEESKATG